MLSVVLQHRSPIEFYCLEAMHPLLFYTLIVIVLGNALFLLTLLVLAWRGSIFKKRKAAPLAALEVRPSGQIMYLEFSEGGQLAHAPKHVGDVDALQGQAVLKQKQQETLSPAELAAFIDAHGQSFWEKFPATVNRDIRGKRAVPTVE